MAIREKNILKTWFETGDKPTQQQFWDLIDSLEHVNYPKKVVQVTADTITFNDGSIITFAANFDTENLAEYFNNQFV